MGEPVAVTVDGRTLVGRAGEPLLDLLRRAGVWIPTLCAHPWLSPYGGCRLCLVARRDGGGSLVPACDTPVAEGMAIETATPAVLAARRRQLALLLAEHPLDCPACPAQGRCFLELLVHRLEVFSAEPGGAGRARRPGFSSPVLRHEPARCVLCTRCIRVCTEVQGVGALGLVGWGEHVRVSTFADQPLDCEFCGQCVAVCPTGALQLHPPWEAVPRGVRPAGTTTCSFCPCGCQLQAATRDGRVVAVEAPPAAPPNRGLLCVKGRFGHDVLVSPERVSTPLVRRGGRLVPASWEEALGAVVAGVRAAQEQGRAVVAFGTPRLTCEDAFLLQHLLREAVGSPHVGVGVAAGARALVEGVRPCLGVARSTATLADLESADLVWVLRADPGRTHPLVKSILLANLRRGRQRVLLTHSLSGGLERHASAFLPLHPLGEEALLWGVCRHLLRRPGAAGRQAEGLAGFAAWQAAVAAYDEGVVRGLTGVGPEKVAWLADEVARARRLVVVLPTGLGLPGDEAAVARAACALLLLLGKHRAPGCGVLVLGEKANLQGCLDVGLHPALLPGGRSAPEPGWGTVEAMARAGEGQVGLLYLVGHDPLGGWPRATHRRDALEHAGCVVVQDAFLTKTTRAARVVLPAALLGEREGTVVGADGQPRRLRRVVEPPRGAVQDGEVFRELGRRLGASMPAPQEVDQRVRGLYARDWAAGAAPALLPPAPPPPPRTWRGILLDVSPQLAHSGSVTRYSSTLKELAPVVAVRLAPQDVEAMGLVPGDLAHLTTGTGEELMRVRVDRCVRPGSAVVLWQSNAEGLGAFLAVDGEARLVDVRRSR